MGHPWFGPHLPTPTAHPPAHPPLLPLLQLPWAKRSAAGNPLETKYPYVCHAEMNAILNKNGASGGWGAPGGLPAAHLLPASLPSALRPTCLVHDRVPPSCWAVPACLSAPPAVAGAKVFVTLFPCNECAKLMIQVRCGHWWCNVVWCGH